MIHKQAQHTSSPSALHYRGDIDGLRAVAVILVLGFHAFPHFVPGGFIGVDVFFVISGYLITSIILRAAADNSFSYRRFYTNRVRRIFPALVLVLTSVFILGWFLFDPEEMDRLSKSIVASSLFVPNFQFWREAGYFDAAAETKPLLHLWSLGVEEQFYIVWPLFLWTLIRFKRAVLVTLVIVTLVSFVVSIGLVLSDPTAAFYAPWSRAWELSLGGTIAALNLRSPHEERASSTKAAIGTAAILAIATAALLLGSHTAFPNLVAALGATALIWAGSTGLANRHLLSGKALVAIGLISYPLYLWHWPILVFARAFNGGALSTAQTLACLVTSLGLAAATYRLVERPIRFGAWKKWSGVPLVATVTGLGMAGFAGISTQGFPLRFPEEVREVLAYGHYDPAKDARVLECWIRNADPFTAFAPKCFLNTPSGRGKRVFVWGDSHAARLYVGMRRTLPDDVDIAQFTKDSCPPLLSFAGPCGVSNRSVLDEIRHSKPDTIVLFAAWELHGNWGTGTDLAKELAETLAQLKAAVPHAEVIVVGPAPIWSDALPKLVYLAWRRSGGEMPDRLNSGFGPDIFANSEGMDAVAKAAGTSYVSLVDILCNDAGCLTHVPSNLSKLTSWDYGHLTADGAAMVSEYMIGKQLLP